MTPKEKAKELIIKMFQPLPASKEAEKGKEHLYYNQMHSAKQCALISVNETLHAFSNIFDDSVIESSNVGGYRNMKKYWTEVKQEIEKL